MSALALEASGLHKAFGPKVAVERVDLAVPAGSFFGLVGRNGAGKTTTLRMCTALLRPDAGTVVAAGADVWAEPDEAKRRIGVVTDDVEVFDHLTGAELLLYVGMLRGMERSVVVERATELLELLELSEAASRLVAGYSHGMTKKVLLASALLHSPTVLFLDEPFEGVDPVSTRSIEVLLHRHVAAGGTVIFSSHVLDVVERLCTDIAMIESGRVLDAGPLDRITGDRRLEDVFLERLGVGAADGEMLAWLRPSSG